MPKKTYTAAQRNLVERHWLAAADMQELFGTVYEAKRCRSGRLPTTRHRFTQQRDRRSVCRNGPFPSALRRSAQA